ncbi:Citrate lyase subunit beta-like protein [Paenarthrobacter nicotinovorans]|nr:Citrate lyase subunit beta-like protein [Paenarthrobacter nicotinovorans]
MIIDLEDAVAATDKPAAREALVASRLDPASTIVRINALGTLDAQLDFEALNRTNYRIVMVPKCESAEQVAAVEGFRLVTLIETPRGVLNADSIIAVPSVVAAMWGAEDLVAALGGNSSRINTGEYRAVAMHARSHVLLVAAAHGRVAVDSGYLDIPDENGLAAEAADAVAVGFTSKAAIHPGQIDIIRNAFSPKDNERDWALGVLAAAKSNKGVFQFEGQMVDSPVFLHAERILSGPQISQSPLMRMTPGSSQNRRMRIRAGPTSSTVVPSLLPTMSDLVETAPKF